MPRRTFALLLLICTNLAHAAGGRPMTTDDAELTTARSCQLESWLGHTRADAQLWLLPACNPGGFEFSAGAVLDWPQGARQATDYVLQGKWKSGELPLSGARPAAAALAFGGLYLDEGRAGARGWSLLYAYLPLTLHWTGTTQTHLNLGWQRDRLAARNDVTYACALAHDFSERWNGFVELFGTSAAAPTAQTGGALLFKGGTIQLDASLGRPLRGSWRDFVWSLGLELYPDALW